MAIERGDGTLSQLLVHVLVPQQGLVQLEVVYGRVPATAAEEEGGHVEEDCIAAESPQLLQSLLVKLELLGHLSREDPVPHLLDVREGEDLEGDQGKCHKPAIFILISYKARAIIPIEEDALDIERLSINCRISLNFSK